MILMVCCYWQVRSFYDKKIKGIIVNLSSMVSRFVSRDHDNLQKNHCIIVIVIGFQNYWMRRTLKSILRFLLQLIVFVFFRQGRVRMGARVLVWECKYGSSAMDACTQGLVRRTWTES